MSFTERLNPICVLSYLFFVIFITMFSTNPIMLGISFMSGIILLFFLAGYKKALCMFAYSIVFTLIITLLNPLFSRQGMTKLFEVGDLIVTFEALAFGLAIGAMFSSVLVWFSVLNILLNSDKITYIFGKYTPKIGTILSVSLGLVPKYTAQYKKVDGNLKALGLYERANFFCKIKLKILTLSTLITWSIEGALSLSDSMSARGYDLKGKRFFGKYKFRISDLIFLIFCVCIGICLLVFMGLGVTDFYFYPTFKPIVLDNSIYIYVATFLFMNVLFFSYVLEAAKWQFSISKI